MELKIGNKTITTAKSQGRRLSLLVWGPSGSGKTTLASTAPGNKLWLLFDPDGCSSLADRDDIFIADYSVDRPSIILGLRSDNDPGQIAKFCEENEINTIIVDSLTTLSEMCLKQAVTEVKGATIEQPTLQGYGRRLSYVSQIICALLKFTSNKEMHIVILAHEDAPEKDEITGALIQTILAGGKLSEEIPIRLSEVWHLADTQKARVITIRASHMKKPMKSRMFLSSDKGSFPWKYDAETQEGEGISDWLQSWIDNGGVKIAVPK